MINFKNIFSILGFGSFGVLCALLSVHCAMGATDAFDFENFAIVDSGDVDISAAPVSMNMNASSVNVGAFDIAGAYLGMPFDEAYTLYYRDSSLYGPREVDSIIYTIARDWKFNLDYECREQGIYAPTELEKCINTLAKDRGLLYASEMHVIRRETGETITIYFTSNATENLAWRVVYNNDVNDIPGDDEKFEDQRQKKILAFWQGVLEKYGAPNGGSDQWLTSGNAYDPMMTAYYGALDLVDQGRNAADAAKNVTDSTTNFRAKPYAF